MELLSILSLLFSIVSLLLTYFLWRRLEKSALKKLGLIRLDLKEGLDSVYKDMEPIINASSRAMGAISNLSDDTKMDKALNRRIGKDLLAQNEDVLEVIKMAFPRVSEYINEHPEAVTKLMPRLNTLISDPEARKRLKLGDLTSSDLTRIWKE